MDIVKGANGLLRLILSRAYVRRPRALVTPHGLLDRQTKESSIPAHIHIALEREARQ